MTEDYFYEPDFVKTEESPTIAERIDSLNDQQFTTFYLFLLKKTEISRHSDPQYQVRMALTVDSSVVIETLSAVERMWK